MMLTLQHVRPFQAVGTPRAGRTAGRVATVVRAAKSGNSNQQRPVSSAPRSLGKLAITLLPALSPLLISLPAHAEPGKIFDFNATMPVMAAQFLLLMVALDKFWFGPVGRHLDARDKELRDKLASVKDNSAEVSKLQDAAEKELAAARAAAQKEIAAAKAELNKERDARLGAEKKKIDAALEKDLAALAAEKEKTFSNLDSQVDKLAEDIIGRLLPKGIKA
uniref:ATP synthase subunit b', chloroplastic n=2 Tax=Auxenochlorella protothecoides TaxID=3075 RepID=A0A1D1ZXW5_AUXPR